MKKKKPKTARRRTELDRIVTQLRAILRRETSDAVLAGNLLRKARKLFADEHGDWLPWLEKNFSLSVRTAQRYIAAAEYVEMRHVSHFNNLSPTVLYELAAGCYDEPVEAAILAKAKAGIRVDCDAASEIRDALAPDDDAAEHAHDDGDDDGAAEEEDAESAAILDGPPPSVPPPAPIPAPPDFALRAFDEAIGGLKRLMTKSSAQFERTSHSGDDLEGVESFIRSVRQRAGKKP
jgi:hypothetical protein